MNNLYNPLKLSTYRELFLTKRILVVGAGAVGTGVCENAVKMGFSVDTADFDTFTAENAAKHCCLVRTPEDVGKNKAKCVSERMKVYLDDGCTSNGIDTDLCMLGPEAIAQYDAVVLCLDNYGAKMLFNDIWLQIPPERRPVVLMDGTYNESAQSVMLDGKEFCLDCLMDNSWIKDAAVKTSCTGPKVRVIDGKSEIVRTTGLASSVAANLTCEQLRAYITGNKDCMNKMISYTAYPNFEVFAAKPMRKKNCRCHKQAYPDSITYIDASVIDTSLDKALKLMEEKLGTDKFELQVHPITINNELFCGFIEEDVCRCCGKPISVMRHESRVYLHELVCEDCRKEGKTAVDSPLYIHKKPLYAFTSDCSEQVKSKTLFALGYPLGSYINVTQRNGEASFLDGNIKTTVFAFGKDGEKMHSVKALRRNGDVEE